MDFCLISIFDSDWIDHAVSDKLLSPSRSLDDVAKQCGLTIRRIDYLTA